MTVVFIWIPMVLVMFMAIGNLWAKAGMKRLFVFYAATLGGALAGAFVGGSLGALVGESQGVFAGIIAGGIVGGAAGLHACGPGSGFPVILKGITFLVGGAIGTLMGMFVGILAGSKNYTVVMKYLLFLIAVEATSLLLAQIIKLALWAKGRFEELAGL
jgi:hypothetical protein